MASHAPPPLARGRPWRPSPRSCAPVARRASVMPWSTARSTSPRGGRRDGRLIIGHRSNLVCSRATAVTSQNNPSLRRTSCARIAPGNRRTVAERATPRTVRPAFALRGPFSHPNCHALSCATSCDFCRALGNVCSARTRAHLQESLSDVRVPGLRPFAARTRGPNLLTILVHFLDRDAAKARDSLARAVLLRGHTPSLRHSDIRDDQARRRDGEP